MGKIFDFLERSKLFARDIFALLDKVPKVAQNVEGAGQLYRSAPAVASEYNEATHSLGPRDRLMKLRAARREAAECKIFLELLKCPPAFHEERVRLCGESQELTNILSAMIVKAEKSERGRNRK